MDGLVEGFGKDIIKLMRENLTLLEIADVLDKAERIGKQEDIPEGNRWIMISDTLAKEFSKALRKLHNGVSND